MNETKKAESEFNNPFIVNRADPYIVKGKDGYYYFTASYPMFGANDTAGYDRIPAKGTDHSHLVLRP